MNHSAFELLRTRTIPSLKLELQDYRHRVTGARHLHLAADDKQNVFLVAFLTAPQDSTGVAHILEHTALCGSQRFPVRDPFFMMIRRSLNTFMNAFTASDWTAYPFASQNRKDFSNLLDVYLDAAFFPTLHPLDFAQEGHRLEFSEPADPSSPLAFRGVVFNEMKGAMSSPVQVLAQELQTQLFPTTTYHHNSGGDPAAIPDLTHEQLTAFHHLHYHPSNALFMTFGDIPAAEHQSRFQEQVLQHFQPLEVTFQIPEERRYTAPRQVDTCYPLDEGETTGKTHIVLGWLLGPITDPKAAMRARVLSDVLLDNSSSPLRHALETCGLGSSPSPLCGFDDNTRETVFACGLEGSEPEHTEAVERLILDTITRVAEEGVPQETLEAVLHQLELSQREITGDGFPYGLQLLVNTLAPVIHGGDPAVALDLDELLVPLREDIKDPAFIKNLARDLLLDNPHRVRLVMRPDPSLGEQRAQAETARLQAQQQNLNAEQQQRIVQLAADLKARQAQEDDPELLPRVGLEDVPADLPIPEGHQADINDLPCTWFSRGTNGMVYQQLVVELPALADELLDLLPLYCLCLSEVGSAGRDYLTTQAHQAALTGGVSARPLVRGDVDDPAQARSLVVLAGKALARNQAALAEILTETFTSPRFDELPRLRELVSQIRTQREESVTQSGHGLAMTAASARLSPTGALLHRWSGLNGLKSLQQLDNGLQETSGLEQLAERLQTLHHLLLNAPRQLLVVSEAEEAAAIAEALGSCWRDYPRQTTSELWQPTPIQGHTREGWSTSTQVNFCARAYPTVAPNHPDAPVLQVLGEFLRNGFLHRAIREQGGAYGAGAGYHGDSSSFRFFSYRDPRLADTYQDFDAAVAWLSSHSHAPHAVEEAILGIVSSIDRPGSPHGEAIAAFYGNLFGRTPDQRRAFRQRVLQVNLSDLRRVAEQYLRPEYGHDAVIGSQAALSAWPILNTITSV